MQRYRILTLLLWLLLWLLLPRPALPQWPGGGWGPPVPNLAHPLLRNLQHWWRAVPGLMGGTTLYDLMPGTLDHGTFTNMGYSSTSGWSPTTHVGGVGQVNFDGTDDYVQTPNPAGVTNTTPFTLCTWGLMTATTSEATVLGNSTAATYSGVNFYIGYGNTNPVFLLANTGASVLLQIGATTAIGLNTWAHECAIYDGSQVIGGLTLYRNGVVDPSSVQGNSGMGAFPDNAWRLGASTNAVTHLQGALDSVMVWGRMLGASEIAALYSQEIRGVPDLLLTVPSVAGVPAAGNPAQFFPFFR